MLKVSYQEAVQAGWGDLFKKWFVDPVKRKKLEEKARKLREKRRPSKKKGPAKPQSFKKVKPILEQEVRVGEMKGRNLDFLDDDRGDPVSEAGYDDGTFFAFTEQKKEYLWAAGNTEEQALGRLTKKLKDQIIKNMK